MSEHEPNGIHEPPIDPLADTNPSLTIRQVQLDDNTIPGWRRSVGLLSLLAAAGLTVATALILMTPAELSAPTASPEPQQIVDATEIVQETPAEVINPTSPPVVVAVDNSPTVLPTVSADVLAAILTAPLVSAENDAASIRVVRDVYNPFTFIPADRPRSEVIQYVAAQGDTIYTIAQRFGLEPESIAWSNDRRIVLVLRPGDVLNIPPVNGVYHQVIGSRTIAEIASGYNVTDPFIVLDSEYNNLFGVSPDTILANGSYIFIPGGTGEDITWNPGVTVDESSGERRGFVTQFAPGDPGSCGNVDNPGGGAFWGNPLPGSTFVRGFSSFHTGIDLSAAPSTPVYAANSGVVVFAGWNSWGYGNTVVLAHGPFLTLYGHMSSWNVSCGQYITVGQVVGAVGSTGNSSGPHLHFEIRSGNTATDPSATIAGLGF